MSVNQVPDSTLPAYVICRSLALLAVLLLFAGFSTSAKAQQCWVNGAINMDFGTVGTAGKTTSTSLGYQCQNSKSSTIYMRVCFFAGEGDPSGMAPRRMTNYNGSYMNYDLYSNTTNTRLVGPRGSSYPIYSWTLAIAAGTTLTRTMNLYGKVPAGQSLPAANLSYQGHPSGSVLAYSFGDKRAPSAANCQAGVAGAGGGSGSVDVGSVGIYANYDDGCTISVATDLDFGNVGNLANAIDQTSTIQLKCPTGTSWRLGLNNGLNASGTTRRMKSLTSNQYVTYEMYRNAARTQRWGNTVGTDTSNGTGTNASQPVTVYGRVPVQPLAIPGTYQDTVTVTLTY